MPINDFTYNIIKSKITNMLWTFISIRLGSGLGWIQGLVGKPAQQ